jgi:hypothetical protein
MLALLRTRLTTTMYQSVSQVLVEQDVISPPTYFLVLYRKSIRQVQQESPVAQQMRIHLSTALIKSRSVELFLRVF